ncbi:MAG TPA: NAD-binding protein, partial [Nannocystaceae bacterium]|nr:NAD-binding protein [Nannocystaceae bacterium]
RLGVKVYYGDASRIELLEAAGCARAELFVLAVDDAEEALDIARTVREHFPRLRIIARARDRPHFIEMRRAGIEEVHRETFAAAYEAGVGALRALGYRAHTAHRLAQRWREHEERELQQLIQLWGQGDDVVFARARLAMEEAERLLRVEQATAHEDLDAAWNNESLRSER